MRLIFATLCLLGLDSVNCQRKVGGWSSNRSSSKNSKLPEVISECKKTYQEQNPNNSVDDIGKVKKVETQVVAGINYRVYFENGNG